MDIEEIRSKLYEDFDAEGIVKREEQRRAEAAKNQPAPMPVPVDIYQRNQDRLYSVAQKSFPKGSSAIVNMATDIVINGDGTEGLDKAYRQAKDDIEALSARGERGRKELRRQQYMQEKFLPAVELVVNSTSPDEVLNSKKALETLDKYALLEGAGSGYTATYIRQAYGNQLGNQTGRSDASVRSDVMRINSLLDNGEVRTAVGIANKLKKRVDEGEAMADDDDYELIGRIVSFYC